jgi:hypothetical protein
VIPEGAIAQLGERLLCKQEVVGSIPSGSTSLDLEALIFLTVWILQSGCCSLGVEPGYLFPTFDEPTAQVILVRRENVSAHVNESIGLTAVGLRRVA